LLSDTARTQLLKLLCKDMAADYLDSLDDATKQNFTLLRQAFLKRFELPSTLQWKRAADVYARTQGMKESVKRTL